MGTGYTRNDTSNNIADGNVINASDLDGEFDAVQAAFNASTGHSHDGTTGEGPKIDTTGLADDAVTGDKIDSTTTVTAASFVGPLTGNASTATALATGRTISLTGDVTGTSGSFDGSGNVSITATIADDSHNHVISNVDGLQTALDGKQATGDYVTATGDTMTGNLNFGDNVKANFGAGSDLQIYHDGTRSYVDETGVGSLWIRGGDVAIMSTASESMATFANNGAVKIYYDNSEKLATTSTGVTFGTGTSATTIGGTTATAGGSTDKNLTISAWYPTSGTNEYGGDLTLAAGRPIGNGSGVTGSVYIKVGKDGASSTTAGSVVDALTASYSTLTFKTAASERMRIDSSGNVGIGTSSPATRLHSVGSEGEVARIGSGSVAFSLGVGHTGTGTGYINLFPTSSPTTSPTSLAVQMGGTERMRIDSSGNVGIGTASPSSSLHVEGAAAPKLTIKDTRTPTTVALQTQNGFGWLATETNHSFGFATNNTERMRIDSSGNVGIGTSSPSNLLHVAGTAKVDGSLYIGNNNAVTASTSGGRIDFYAGGTYRGGEINSYGGTNGGYLSFRTGVTTGQQPERFRMEADGDFHADGDVIAYSTTISDERLKENIVGIDGALDKVSQLNGYTFSYKADGKISAGVIAQEVEKVLPEAVSEKELPLKADDGEQYKVVNYDALHGLLIEAIKELKAEVADLKSQLEKN